jgi:hypothetical protein
MTLYSGVLFVHVVSALGIFAALGIEAVTLSRLRQSTDSTEARRWLDLAPGLPAIAIGSLLFLLLSGGYMTSEMSGWNLAWPKVALAALILIAPFGAVTRKRLRAIRQACFASNTNESDLTSRLRDPVLKHSLDIRISLALAIVLLMTAKPGLQESLGIVAGFALLGFASTFLLWRDNSVAQILRADSRD